MLAYTKLQQVKLKKFQEKWLNHSSFGQTKQSKAKLS